MSRTTLAILLLLPGMLSLAGCAREKSLPQRLVDENKSLIIGLIPEQNIFRQFERYEPLADYLSRKTGTKITLNIHLDPEGKRVLERFGARKFIETTNRDYDVVVNYAEAIGLDLATYGYTND